MDIFVIAWRDSRVKYITFKSINLCVCVCVYDFVYFFSHSDKDSIVKKTLMIVLTIPVVIMDCALMVWQITAAPAPMVI